MCGEEEVKWAETSARSEIPPRVRRRVGVAAVDVAVFGNTSACAEKSARSIFTNSDCGKYLRVCGEEEKRLTKEKAA